jgi:hypothetical protein
MIHGPNNRRNHSRGTTANEVPMKRSIALTLSMLLCLTVLSCNTRSFSLKDDKLIDRSARHDDGKVQISQNPDGGYHISGQVTVTFNPSGGYDQNIWADGVTHTWIGKVTYQGYVFDSNSGKPLVFRVDKDNGYTYVGGKGTVTAPDGKSTTLP